MSTPLRLGTRRSSLALAQAREVAALLTSRGIDVDIVPMTTRGDRGAPAGASPAGRKGLWVNDIVDALVRGEVDLAVHSAKDLPADDPDGVVVAAVPERASPFDMLVQREVTLAAGARVGSSSLRRRGQLRAARPDLDVVEVRGNVDTRLRKLADGEVDGLVLAAAGLVRLDVVPEHASLLSAEEMVPAPGQGALAVQTRDDGPAREVVAALDHRESRLAFGAERALVRMVGGGCALPLGAFATVTDGVVRLSAVVLRPDGTSPVRAVAEADSPETAAREAADSMLARGAAAILAELG
ncbi:MAG TPA: hydroxymethylbilane synthase [Actinomycetota bacterium]